jgi:hypothetical protein
MSMHVNRTTVSVTRWQLAILLAALLGARDAHAYLDPTTGSMILQGIVGGVMAGLFVMRRQWTQLKGWFSRRRTAGTESSQASSGGDAD